MKDHFWTALSFVVAVLASVIGGYIAGTWRSRDDGKDPYGIKHQANVDFCVLLVALMVVGGCVFALHHALLVTYESRSERLLEALVEACSRPDATR